MKKYYFIYALLLLGSKAVNAQYVTIPDAKFAAYLHTVVPSAMSGNQMDTTNVAVLSLARIYIENKGILNISGAQYFKALVTLDCGNGSPSTDSNHITSLPTLPATIDSLICGNNQIDSLPALPGGLTVLKCYSNKLTNLPTLPVTLIYLNCSDNSILNLPILPSGLDTLICSFNVLAGLPLLPGSLRYIDCDSNQLTSLPNLPGVLTFLFCYENQLTTLPPLPSTLLALDCDQNQLTSLPALPGLLQNLGCNNNQLTSLPALPGTLNSVDCSYNQLTSLPALPGSLGQLYCGYNQLTSLPTLPGSLGQLFCGGNPLTSLPVLPPGLTGLFCYYDQLTSLPVLPSGLTNLECQNNNISCFPVFPSTLVDTNNCLIESNPFNCLPNYVRAMDKATLEYPLCMPGNSNGCPVTPGVVGFTYEDVHNTCVRSSGDSDLVNIPIQLYDISNTLLSQTYTAADGVYDFPISPGTYKVVIDTSGLMPFLAQCTYPGLDSTVVVTSIDTDVNFSLTCKPGFDVGVQSVATSGLIFPGIQHDLSVVAGDMSHWYNLNCADGDSGTVQIDVSGPVTYVGPGVGALTPTAIAGNSFKYTIPNFGAINNNTAFNLILETDTTAQAGDTICVSVTVTPLADNSPGNNTYQYCYYVVNSHDPNNKSVYPVNVAPGYDGWFTYTIHFQNTGSSMAKNIQIKDELDSHLNKKTFQLLCHSTNCFTLLTGNMLTFEFQNINLPDSTVNLPNSSGYVQYRIKPLSNLPNGTIIQNTADIYFDYNTPIITNTTQNVFSLSDTAKTKSVSFLPTISVYPNPNKGEFTVSVQNIKDQFHVIVYNSLGQEVFSSALYSGDTQISIGNKSPGVYFYRVTDESGMLFSDGKIIVE